MTHPLIARTTPKGRPRRRLLAGITAAGIAAVTLVGCAAPAATLTPVAPPIATPSAAGSDGSALTTTDVNAWLDGLVPTAIEDAGIAGAAVSVVSDGQILTSRGFGTSDVAAEASGNPSPVDPDRTLFRVGSVSKVGTATAVMQLVERGDLDLDVDVSEYLDFEIPRRFETPITLRNLLSHTAGFEEAARGIILPPDADPDLRDYLMTDPPAQEFEPGTVPAYSNYGNALAGYIVERVSGMPFEEYLDSNVLARAGMTSSSYAQPLPDELAQRMSKGYADSSQPPMPFERVAGSPAGALSATASDMGRFMLAQLGDLPAAQSVLEPATIELMQQPALDSETLGAFADGPRMTLGLFDESRNGRRILGHGGDTQVFHSHMQVYPDDGVGIFVALNSSGTDPLSSLSIRQAIMKGFTDRYFPADADDSSDPVSVDTGAAERAAAASGTYESARGTFSTFFSAVGLTSQTQVVDRGDGTILVNPGPYSYTPAVFEEVKPWVWREVGGQQLLTMRQTDGTVDAIGYDSAFTLLRVSETRTGSFALPVLGLSVLVLVLVLIAWPVGAVIRRRYQVPSPVGRRGRVARILTRIGVIATVVALVGWVGIVSAISAFAIVPDAPLRVVQGVQAIGLLAVIPAAITVVDAVRFRSGWRRALGAALTLLALGGVAWFAIAFRLIAPEVSY